MVQELVGKAVIVIGAETPAGGVVAMALAEAGADVACVAATTDGTAALAVRSLGRKAAALGVRAPVQAIDASIGTAVQVAFRQLAKELGRVDGAVCAVDVQLDKALERTSDAEWAKVIGANLGAAFFMMRSAAREIAPGGAIVAVIDGQATAPGRVAYAAAKAGVRALVQGLAGELAERDIRIYGVASDDSSSRMNEDELGPLIVRLLAGGEAAGASGMIFRYRALA